MKIELRHAIVVLVALVSFALGHFIGAEKWHRVPTNTPIKITQGGAEVIARVVRELPGSIWLEASVGRSLPKVYIGVADYHNSLITGSTPGDFCVRVERGPVVFSKDNGVSITGTIDQSSKLISIP